eukprot:3005133-Pleurochrysis_carterae.AAC.2
MANANGAVCLSATTLPTTASTSNAYSSSSVGPLVAHVEAQPAPALPASDSSAAPNDAVVDAGVAVLEVFRVLVGLEKQRPQLQHVRRAVGQGERKANISLAQELVLLELVPQVLRALQLQVAVEHGNRRCARARWPTQRALRASRQAWPCGSCFASVDAPNHP